MRVLFFGTTGTQKSDLMKAIQKIAFDEAVSEGEIAGKSNLNDYIKILDIEDEICKGTGTESSLDHVVTYLNAPEHERHRRWMGAMESVIDRANSQPRARYAFLSLHGFYWRGRQLLCDLDLNLIAHFNPSVIVTLCDDLCDIQTRIKNGDPEDYLNNQLLLREISAWRSAESALADLIARGIGDGEPLRNFLIGVKHPPEMFYKLLFRRDILPIYASFPISYVRSKKSEVKELLDNFRWNLGEKYTVFDPLAIDEFLLSDRDPSTGKELTYQELFNKYNGTNHKAKDHRWHFGDCSAVPGCPDAVISGYEYIDTLLDIKKQIPNRDFRLIDQVKWLGGIIVAYRPLIDGHEPGGVRAELNYAHDNTVPVYNFHPPEDRKKTGAFGPLDPYEKCRGPYNTVEDLLQEVSNHSYNITSEKTWE